MYKGVCACVRCVSVYEREPAHKRFRTLLFYDDFILLGLAEIVFATFVAAPHTNCTKFAIVVNSIESVQYLQGISYATCILLSPISSHSSSAKLLALKFA